MRVVLATANPAKVAEIAEILGDAVELVGRPAVDVDEDADTLAGNAILKARAVHEIAGLPALADDTGLEVDALGGAPGVRSARFAGEAATDADNVSLLLERLDGVVDRTARFRTVAALVDGDDVRTWDGVCEGIIASSPRGEHGFGYDPVFVPEDGDGRTFAEMASVEKHAISHRGRAFPRLREISVPGEFRLDELTGEWVNIVGHRQARPNLPASGCPFCPGGLEAPEPYDTRWFPNRWPALEPPIGASEVILYSSRHEGSLGSLGREQIRKVIDLWGDRTEALFERPEVAYVLVFESRGAEVGATIHHPHGQIYGYPFVPPAPAAVAARGDAVVAAELEAELHGTRVVFDDAGWVAYVPYASRYPYGLRVVPREPHRRLDRLDADARDGLALAMADVLGRYDRLWRGQPGRSEIFPYLMWFHQAPADRVEGAADWPRIQLHLAPPQRAPGVARYIAAGEVGSGTFSNPVVPEAAAETLRAT